MTFPDFDTLRENISYFAKSNAAGIEVESSLRTDGEFGQLRSYLLSKLFWEPDMSEEEYEGYMDEFLTEVYGEGGTYLRQYIELANEVTEDICFDLSPACSKVFPIPTVKNHEKGELPEKLTVEMLKDYEDVEWTPYWNWYTDVKENRITSEGTKLFEKAMESAETKEQKNRIAKASAQVGYIKSYYLYECIQAGGVKQMITTFINEHADEFSKAEQKNLANKIEKMAKRQMEKEYAEYNYDLCKDMVEAGITHTGVSLEKWQQLDFANIPSAW